MARSTAGAAAKRTAGQHDESSRRRAGAQAQTRPSGKGKKGAAGARPPAYDARVVEEKWAARWAQSRIYQPDLDRAPRPYYNLMMFPYPSAAGLHIGNMYSYVGSDVHGRWMAMRGYDVFEPIGFDAFGIHSENFAIKRGVHPRAITAENIENFRRQLKRIGNRFDWSHEVVSADPSYYRWTQWIFVKLFRAGLVERKVAPVNWCPNDKTVLADEQVIAGRCERCGAVVERRELEQWFFKITRYADRLLSNLEQLDWSERVKALQRNWIGRSEGLELDFAIAGTDERVQVYTTRPDTVYGVTFIALAPSHGAVDTITEPTRMPDVAAYREQVRRAASASADASLARDVSGAFTGAFAIHPLTGEHVPVWVSDYVIGGYGTGAVMGVPAHDARDMAFAQAMGLPVRWVVRPAGGTQRAASDQDATGAAGAQGMSAGAITSAGIVTDSGDFSGMTSEVASAAIVELCEARGIGRRRVSYHLRDWLISRQRYWGAPIPIVYCPDHGAVPVPEEQLPVLLPEVEDYAPRGTGSSPLAAVESFVQTTCPVCGAPARRETDVSDNFVDSAWYYLRYPSTDDDQHAWNPIRTRTWLPVDMYVGGAEHSVLHLMYARFITMALHDLGLLDFEEPFRRFRANGMITKNGAKISKSRGQTVNPDAYIDRYGADVFRTYMLFMGPYEAGGDFSDAGIGGVVRFLDRVGALVSAWITGARERAVPTVRARMLHSTIKQVTRDIEALKYNTAIAALMKYVNTLADAPDVARAELDALSRMLAPFAPFLAEELWERLGGTGSVHTQPWPEVDEEALADEVGTIVIQVDGRVRDRIELPTGLSDAEVAERAAETARVRSFLQGRSVRTVVHVPGRLVNLVTGALD